MNINKLHSINPLFDFQILCDTDLGLYRLIKREFYNRETFNDAIFESDDLRFVKARIISRTEINPLYIFCKKDVMTKKELDDLYKEFLDKEYDNILELSPPTAIMNIVHVANNINGNIVNSTILCRNESEKKWIHKHNKSLKCIISDYKNFDVTMYDTIYIKDIYALLSFKQESIDSKNIIIGRYLFNFEDANQVIELPLIEISNKYYKKNKFMIASVYKNVKIPFG